MSSRKILSIDIGLKNFAQYIETISSDDMTAFKNIYTSIPVSKRTKDNSDIKDIICEMALKGKREHISVHNILKDDEEAQDKYFDISIRKKIIEHLDSQREVFHDVDTVVIEQQYFKTFSYGKRGKPVNVKGGGEANIRAIKISEIVISWFLIHFPLKEVIVFPSSDKTETFGAPKNLTKPQRKKWSIEFCTSLFEKREDDYVLDLFKRTKKICKQKLDDMCDAMLQCQAFKYRYLIQI